MAGRAYAEENVPVQVSDQPDAVRADQGARRGTCVPAPEADVVEVARWRQALRRAGNRITDRIGQFVCGMRGHDDLMAFQGRRITLRCTNCGRDTQGWKCDGPPPTRRG